MKKTVINCKNHSFYHKEQKNPFGLITNEIKGLKQENQVNLMGWDF